MVGRNLTLADLGPAVRRQVEDKLIEDTLRSVKEKAETKPKPKHKYGAEPTRVGDLWFASKLEANRYAELKLSERAGTITELVLQPRFPITVNGIAICEVRADFSYRRVPGGEHVVEDAKGMVTRLFRIKSALVRALYGISIIEVRAS